MDRTDNDLLDNYRQIHCKQIDSYDIPQTLFTEDETDGLKLFHINIRSYYKNFDNLLVLLEGVKVQFDIIVLSEAWLDPDKILTVLDGYEIYCTKNNWNRNDGIVVYIKTVIPSVAKQLDFGDSTGLEISFKISNRQYKLLALYRSPAMDFDVFTNGLRDYCDLMTRDTTYIITGDLNIDILDSTSSIEKDVLLNSLCSAGYLTCIDLPTRVTDHSRTCIDHIFIKHSDYRDITAAVLRTDITDHYAIIAKINYDIKDKPKDTNIRTYVDTTVLDGLIRDESWEEVIAENNVERSWETFINKIESLKTKSTTTKNITSRFKKIKPWITMDLIKNIRKRDKISKIAKKQPFNEQLQQYYRNLRNNVCNLIRKSKYEYYKNKIVQSKGNSKVFWNTVNEFSGMSNTRDSFPIKYFCPESDIGGGAVRGVASSFNKYFSEVGCKLAKELPPLDGPPIVDDAEHIVDHSFQFAPVSETLVERCVMSMRGGSAPGIDEILPSTLKNNIKFLVRPLTHSINLSLRSGIFPSKFKIAKVIPIFKSNDKSCLSNYRPISLLSVLSKVLEKCVKWQLQQYLERNNLLSPCQFGFRKGRNSSDALFSICKYAMDQITSNKKCLVVFIDLAKAFDSIDRKLLLRKLHYIGIQGTALSWFQSYFENRKQVVSILNQQSEAREIKYGVIQGSTLGPLLFLIYINNLDKLTIESELYLFADDTAVVFSADTWGDVFDKARHGLSKIKTWFDENVLTMNIDKTKCLPFALRTGSEPPAELQLILHTCGNTNGTTCSCRIIERVINYKYLGVMIDSKLRWENHIILLKNRLRKFIFTFYNLGHILNEQDLKIVYYAHVQSILQYGIIAWGGVFKSIIDPLTVIQKSILKSGFHKSRQYPSQLLFQETSILSIRQLFIRALLIFTAIHKEWITTPITHTYCTRNAQQIGIQVPRVMKSAALTNSFYIANILLRNIPPELRVVHVPIVHYNRMITNWLLGAGADYAESLMRSVYMS